MRETIKSIIEGLRAQPITLALVSVNLIFVIALMMLLRDIASAAERRDRLLSEALLACTTKER